jgi:pimeloyl-ACP methyl ester carboxylesterase
VFRFAGSHSVVAILLLFGAAAAQVFAADPGLKAPSSENPSYIVVGFVGGFVRHTNHHHGPVLLAERLRQSAPKDAYVRVFENRHRRAAYRNILRLIDTDHNGALSADERSAAHIILFGQSWGASAAVMLARDLDRIDIPVLLTVQVDSVAKPWQNDRVIPDNVAEAANFYQPHGFVHGRREIRAADNGRTQIVGNYRFDYQQNPVSCPGMSWFDRKVTPDHMQSECDPHLWSEVEGLVRQQFQPEPQKLASNPGPGSH